MIQTQPISIFPDSIPSPRQELEMLRTMPLDDLINSVASKLVTFAINLAIAILVFYVGKFIITRIIRVITSLFIRRKADRSLSTFIISLVRMVLYFILIVTVIGILGIETSSFIALFASAGVAVGMALSGTLQNFAGGVLILLIKPYKVGDYIEAQGYAGTVKEIQIFHTIICTPDNKSIIIPNGGLSTGSVNNYSREDYRRVDWSISISYGDDVDLARKTILEIFASDDRIVSQYIEDDRRERNLHDPAEDTDCSANSNDPDCHRSWLWRLFHRQRSKVRERIDDWDAEQRDKALSLHDKVERKPVVWVNTMADSSINLTARAWTRNEFYWSVYFELNERFYKELPTAGINFPFPQLDVHLKS